MRRLRSLLVRLAGSFGFPLGGAESSDDDIRSELESHIDLETSENIRRGMAPTQARRQAVVASAGLTHAAESMRQQYRFVWLEQGLADVRYALRGLRRSPSFALAAILTVALGIGASAAIFSVTDAVLLRPLPIPNPGDFAYLGWHWAKGDEIPALTALQYEFVREHNRSFDAVAVYGTHESSLGDDAAPVRGLRVGGEFFRTIGFPVRLGREFDALELQSGGPAVVILGDAVWRNRFGADPKVIGRKILMDGAPRTVVGVMPEDFRFPPSIQSDGYLIPLPIHASVTDEGHNTEVVGRLRHGISREERDADLQLLSQTFRAAYPTLAPAGESFMLFTHRDVYAATIRRTIWLLFGAVSLLLLIACANTATLMLVRASVRQREIAVRTAIGAGPGRILRQLITEGIVLSAIATTAGVVLGTLALRAFLKLAPTALPAGMTPRIDARVLAFLAAISAATAIVFGLVAGLPSLQRRLHSGTLRGARGATRGAMRTREALVFLETSAAVVLLAGATLLVASFSRLISVDPGFEPDRVMAVRLGRLPSDYDAARRDAMLDRLLDRVRSLPGVERAALSPNLPLERGLNFSVDTREHPEMGMGAAELRFVSPNYLATLGIPLLAGRDFDGNDVEGHEPVAIVNQALAHRFWGDSSPIGRTIQVGHYKDRWSNPRMERQTRVVGVAADIHEIGLDRAPRPTVLLARAQASNGVPVLLARTTPAASAALRRAVADEDSRLAPTLEPLSAAVRRSVAGPRFRALLIGAFAISALLVAAIGIYGVIAAVVQQRTREIGICIALGASRGVVAIGVVRRCLVSVAGGVVTGLAAFWAMRRILTSMLYQTSNGDPVLLTVAIAILSIIAAFAAWIPTRRAMHVDPAVALRLD
jgi:predicted permease